MADHRTLEIPGFEVVDMEAIHNAQLGALCKSIGTLASNYVQQHRLPFVPVPRNITPARQHKIDRLKWADQDGKRALEHVVDVANRGSAGLYGGAFGVFEDEAPRLYVHYQGYNDDPDPDWRDIQRLYIFDDFVDTEQGAAVAHLAVSRALDGRLTSTGPRSDLGSMPDGFFDQYRKVQPVS